MTSPKIVLMCGAGYVSGKEIVALELAKGLVARGLPVHVVASSWNDGDFVHRLSDAHIGCESMPLGFISATLSIDCIRMTSEQILKWPGLLWSYRSMLRRERPATIIHTNWHHLILLWPFLKPNRDYFWLHECIPNTPRYRRLFARLARRIGKFVCVSAAVANSLFALKIERDKVEVVHNGISDCASSFASDRPTHSGSVNVGIVGQIGPWKGHVDLFHAFVEVHSHYSSAQLHIFGTGKREFVDQLRDVARQLNIESKIHWHGFKSDRTEIYSRLDICVVPSRSNDPLPTTAIEAAVFGVPTIATRRGGLPEIVIDNETGLLVDAESPSQLSFAICRLLDQPQLRRQMGAAARCRATTHFTQERFVADFLRILGINCPQTTISPQLAAINK